MLSGSRNIAEWEDNLGEQLSVFFPQQHNVQLALVLSVDSRTMQNRGTKHLKERACPCQPLALPILQEEHRHLLSDVQHRLAPLL